MYFGFTFFGPQLKEGPRSSAVCHEPGDDVSLQHATACQALSIVLLSSFFLSFFLFLSFSCFMFLGITVLFLSYVAKTMKSV